MGVESRGMEMRINMEVFTLGQRQDFMTLLNLLESEGVTELRFARQSVQESIDGQVLAMKKRGSNERMEVRRGTKCNNCGSPATLSPVNTTRCTLVGLDERGKPYRAAIECQNEGCRHTEYSTKTPFALVTRK